ncbi:hypothetical protein OPU71_07370 [Niveibacterium sp. 24ML]|uniref:hypothetical protein n=1 Tax=Niveibacterium sp. 24ML TaxID=2985512 RepID=UPI00226DD3DD|nr:hypothetical protein [Niveibacterium sp. 24ML]MCX9155945.1 hypothetical protein [Niveibacterium sp. 24ML]
MATMSPDLPTRFAPPAPDLDEHLRADRGFPAAFLRAICAVALDDGDISLSEFAALDALARRTEDSALSAALLVHGVEHPIGVPQAIADLHAASEGVDQGVRAAALDAAMPLLKLQGARSRELIQRFAQALGQPTTHLVLDATPDGAPSLWTRVSRGSKRLLDRDGLVALAEECIHLTGDTALHGPLADYLDGRCPAGSLRAALESSTRAASERIAEFEAQVAARVAQNGGMSNLAQQLAGDAERLRQQIGQRLAMVEARIDFERQTFREDIDELVHDAGNGFMLEVAERLKTDDWKQAKVWERIGSSQFGKDVERRVNRAVSRREQALHLMYEDLRLFQEDMKLTRVSILERQHHSGYAQLIPPLRMGARVANAVDGAAKLTLGAGALSIVGSGAAAYVLGTAAVLPLIAPAAPLIGGAMVVAGLVKWFSDPQGRKDKELAHKREAFERVLREQLEQAEASFGAQLERIGEAFRDSADHTLRPMILEGQAAERLASQQGRLARQLIERSRQGLTRIAQRIQTTPD